MLLYCFVVGVGLYLILTRFVAQSRCTKKARKVNECNFEHHLRNYDISKPYIPFPVKGQ